MAATGRRGKRRGEEEGAMVFLWLSYGFLLWFFPKVFLWSSYGFSMVFLRLSYGLPMAFLWFS